MSRRKIAGIVQLICMSMNCVYILYDLLARVQCACAHNAYELIAKTNDINLSTFANFFESVVQTIHSMINIFSDKIGTIDVFHSWHTNFSHSDLNEYLRFYVIYECK